MPHRAPPAASGEPGQRPPIPPEAPAPRQPPLADALRRAADAVAAVLGGATLTAALAADGAGAAQTPGGSRAAAQDLAYAALRAYGRGDFFIGRLMSRAPPAPLRALLLVALARLEARPEQAYVIVDQAVMAAARFASGRFRGVVNGVLRNFLRQQTALLAAAGEDKVARWQHPAWWLARLRAQYPRDWRAIAEAGNSHPPMALRVNQCRITAADFRARLDAAGIACAAPWEDAALLLDKPLPVQQVPGFSEGLASVQDLGAQRAAALLDARPGMRVLDACAAPGGKCAHLLERAPLDLTALDLDAGRMERVAANLRRLGLAATLRVADCRDTAAWWDGRGYDRILADVPCSASGVARRHPDIKWLRRESDIAGFAAQQAAILAALWRVLAPGGKLLYATCSVFAEENEARIGEFAACHPDCMSLPLAGDLTQLQLLPRTEHDGFFYALLQKRA